jgi:hypothetical protein
MCQHLPLQDPPNFFPNWDFWLENTPSGNSALEHFFGQQPLVPLLLSPPFFLLSFWGPPPC